MQKIPFGQTQFNEYAADECSGIASCPAIYVALCRKKSPIPAAYVQYKIIPSHDIEKRQQQKGKQAKKKDSPH
jgi:hypothetical protein